MIYRMALGLILLVSICCLNGCLFFTPAHEEAQDVATVSHLSYERPKVVDLCQRYTRAITTKDEALFCSTMEASLLENELYDFRRGIRRFDMQVTLGDVDLTPFYNDDGEVVEDTIEVCMEVITRYQHVPDDLRDRCRDFCAELEFIAVKVNQQWVFKKYVGTRSERYL